MRLLIVLGAALLLFSGCYEQNSTQLDKKMEEKITVILDTDANNELDDQHAIAYLLMNGDVFDVKGVTVNRTNNGGGIDEQVREAERVVELCGLQETVPVLAGADANFETIQQHLDSDNFDGAAAVNFIIEHAERASADEPLLLLPVGKLTNIALAIEKNPAIIANIKVLWLGSNYPDPGEYNQVNDEPSLNYLLDSDVHFEIALVRYGKPSGTAAVTATMDEIKANMPGKGARVEKPVEGRHGGEFYTFGDYSVNLFEHARMYGEPPSRSLFDMAAVAIAKNPDWAEADTIPAPILDNGAWENRPDNERQIILWENFDKEAIMADFYETMENPVLVE